MTLTLWITFPILAGFQHQCFVNGFYLLLLRDRFCRNFLGLPKGGQDFRYEDLPEGKSWKGVSVRNYFQLSWVFAENIHRRLACGLNSSIIGKIAGRNKNSTFKRSCPFPMCYHRFNSPPLSPIYDSPPIIPFIPGGRKNLFFFSSWSYNSSDWSNSFSSYPQPLVIGGLGRLSIGKQGPELRSQVIFNRYERSSIVVTTHRVFPIGRSSCATIFPLPLPWSIAWSTVVGWYKPKEASNEINFCRSRPDKL